MQGRIRVPADLDAVTAIGDEDHSGIDPAAVERIWQAARHWYQAGMHPAIQLCLRHNGKVVLNRAIGHGWGNAPTDPPDAEKIPVQTDTPFCVYSSAKAITATVVHMLVERGQFSLDDRVCDYLPTYTSHGKHRTTIRHVMTHSAGVPFPTGPKPDLKRADDHEYAQEQLGKLRPLYRPGLVHIYHALTWGPLMREIVYAATGKDIREILATEILDPLGFRWTNFGVAEEDIPLVAPSHATGKQLPAPIAAAVPQGDRRDASPDHPAHQHTDVPHHRRPVVQHHLERRRDVAVRRNMAPRRRTRRCPGDEPGNTARRGAPKSAAATGFRDGPAAGPLGHRFPAGHRQKFGPVRPQCAGGVRSPRADQFAIWADPERQLAGGVVSSGKPGSDPEVKRYRALMDRIAAEIPRAWCGGGGGI